MHQDAAIVAQLVETGRSCKEPAVQTVIASPRPEARFVQSPRIGMATLHAGGACRSTVVAAPRTSVTARSVPLLALGVVKAAIDGGAGREAQDSARACKAAHPPPRAPASGQLGAAHRHQSPSVVPPLPLGSPRRVPIADSGAEDAASSTPDTGRGWRNRSRTVSRTVSGREACPAGHEGPEAGDHPTVAEETVAKLMDVLEVLTGVHGGDPANSGAGVAERRSRRSKPRTPSSERRSLLQSLSQCASPVRGRQPAPRDAPSGSPGKGGSRDGQVGPNPRQSLSSIESSDFTGEDEDDDLPSTVSGSAPRGFHGAMGSAATPGAGRAEEAPGPQPLRLGPLRLPLSHQERRRRPVAAPPASARAGTARLGIAELQAEVARQQEVSRRALEAKRQTELRLNANVAKNDELQTKLNRLAEGMLRASSKIFDLETRLAQRAQEGEGSGQATGPEEALANQRRAAEAELLARVAAVEAKLVAGSQCQPGCAEPPTLAELRSRLARHEEVVAAEEEAAARVAQLEARVLARDLDAALAAGGGRFQLGDARRAELEALVAEQREAAEARALARIAQLEERLSTAAQEHEERLAAAVAESAQLVQASEAKCRQLEEKLVRQQATAASVEVATVELFAEMQDRGAAKDVELERVVKQMKACEQQLREAQAKGKDLEERLASQIELASSAHARSTELVYEAQRRELELQLAEAASAEATFAARIAELEARVEQKEAEKADVMARVVEEGRQRLQVFEALCEELSAQLEQQRRSMAASDAATAARVAKLDAELATQRQLLQHASVEARYSEECLKASEARSGELQAKLVRAQEAAAAEAGRAAAQAAELEARLARERTAMDEVLSRHAAEHTRRLQASEARGLELEERLARFSAPPTQRPAVVEVAAQTAEGPSDSEVLREVVRAACLRLGADWSSWLRAATGRCLVVPAWRGLYLTLPRVAAAAPDGGAAEEAVRGAPAPPGSDFWDWPLSRREKWERAVFVDRQMLLADQRALMEHAEVLRSDCIQNGIEVSPYLWDSF